MSRAGAAKTEVRVDGRRVHVTNLTKIYWPATGMTKGELIDYYVRVAPVLVPHIAGHPLTLHRFPDGVDGRHWYETRVPKHPSWLRTQLMYSFRSRKDVEAPVVDDLPGLVWAANTGAIELHPFLGTVDGLNCPTVVVFDLDPGPPASLPDAARVALTLRDLLDGLGLRAFPKTSGGKGLHVYVPLNSRQTYERTKTFARTIARDLTERDPEHVVDVMPKARRAGRVFVDWSQNDGGKSTVAPYSLRGLRHPTVSMPATWDEVEAVASGADLRRLVFLAGSVPDRLEEVGDLFAPVLEMTQELPPEPARRVRRAPSG